ncbi:MAG: hypothetical protein K2O39_02520 [Clostridiales bacterium]|nr:hypothetical protein [Clostridiales bacterium]
MTKFIQLTERGDGKRVLFNVNKIVSIREEANGLCFVDVNIGNDDDTVLGLPCLESYTSVYNELAAYDYIAFGGA